MGKVIEVQIEKFRMKRKLTQAELAERSGVGQSTISDLETGRSKGVAFNVLERLGDALGCDPLDLLDSVKKGK